MSLIVSDTRRMFIDPITPGFVVFGIIVVAIVAWGEITDRWEREDDHR